MVTLTLIQRDPTAQVVHRVQLRIECNLLSGVNLIERSLRHPLVLLPVVEEGVEVEVEVEEGVEEEVGEGEAQEVEAGGVDRIFYFTFIYSSNFFSRSNTFSQRPSHHA